MINILHLLWVVPLATMFGCAIACLMVMAKKSDRERR